MALTDSDAQLWVDEVFANSGLVHPNSVDTLFQTLKTDGIWAKADAIGLLRYGGSNYASRLCLKRRVTGAFIGGTWANSSGFTGDGVDDYFRTEFNPTIGTPNYVQNNASFGVKIKDNEDLDIDGSMGSASTSFRRWSVDAGWWSWEVNSGGDVNSASQNFWGLIGVSRFNATDHSIFVDGVQDVSEPESSRSVSNSLFYVLAENSNTSGNNSPSNFCANTAEAYYIGAGLTATEWGNLRTALDTYYTNASAETPVSSLATGTTISGITQKDGVTFVADGTYVQHLYADDNKGTNETPLEVGQTTGGEVTFTGELPVGKVRFIRVAYQDAGRDVVKEQFFTD